MDNTAGSRTGSKESRLRDSELTPEAVNRDTPQVEESPQQKAPDGDRPRRRIAIGTQRANSEQTETSPRYTYITSENSSSSTEVTADKSDTSSLKAETEKKTQQKKTKDSRRGRSERGGKASAFADSAPLQKRVTIPNLRQDLDEDLEKDFEAALVGLEVDSLLEQSLSLIHI